MEDLFIFWMNKSTDYTLQQYGRVILNGLTFFYGIWSFNHEDLRDRENQMDKLIEFSLKVS